VAGLELFCGCNSESDFASIRAPTLLVWGRHDPLVLPSMGERLLRAIPGSRLILFEESGHLPMIEEPERFNRVLVEFLSSSRPGSHPRPQEVLSHAGSPRTQSGTTESTLPRQIPWNFDIESVARLGKKREVFRHDWPWSVDRQSMDNSVLVARVILRWEHIRQSQTRGNDWCPA
jgi:hypothetical protein